jgi:hypothetical protein
MTLLFKDNLKDAYTLIVFLLSTALLYALNKYVLIIYLYPSLSKLVPNILSWIWILMFVWGGWISFLLIVMFYKINWLFFVGIFLMPVPSILVASISNKPSVYFFITGYIMHLLIFFSGLLVLAILMYLFKLFNIKK